MTWIEPDSVIEVVCERLGVGIDLVRSSRCYRPIPEARAYIACVLHEKCFMSYPQIERAVRPGSDRAWAQSTWRYTHQRLRDGVYGRDWPERVEAIVKEARLRDESEAA